jgi:chromosome segregation ATPase
VQIKANDEEIDENIEIIGSLIDDLESRAKTMQSQVVMQSRAISTLELSFDTATEKLAQSNARVIHSVRRN